MMTDTPGIAHTAAGDDDGATLQASKFAAAFGVADKVQVGPGESARTRTCGEMLFEHLGGLGRQGRIDEYLRGWQPAMLEKPVEVHEKLLRALHRKGGNQDWAAGF